MRERLPPRDLGHGPGVGTCYGLWVKPQGLWVARALWVRKEKKHIMTAIVIGYERKADTWTWLSTEKVTPKVD